MNRKVIISLVLATLLLLSTGCNSSEEQENTSTGGEPALTSSDTEMKPPEPEPAPEPEPEPSSEPAPEPEAPDSGDPLLILVNASHPIEEKYQVELEAVQGDYKMSMLAAAAARDMLAAAKADGYNLMMVSGYRSVATSAKLYNNKVAAMVAAGWGQQAAEEEAARWVAPPGTSEHHTGLAMDVVSSDYFNYYAELEHAFENFDEFTWLFEHCAEYGFVLRYPKDKQEVTGITYEPWHYRFVGKENAKKIMEQKLCLEEYLGEGKKE